MYYFYRKSNRGHEFCPLSTILRPVPAVDARAPPVCIGGHVTASIQTMLNSSDSEN